MVRSRRRRPPQSSSVGAFSQDIQPIALRWMLRCLVGLNGYRQLLRQTHFQDDELAGALGLLDPANEDFYDPKDALRKLRVMYRQSERDARVDVPDVLRQNARRLAKLLGLDDASVSIFQFAILLHDQRNLASASDLLGELSTNDLAKVLANLLDHSVPEIASALSPNSLLQRSGLVSVDRSSNFTLSNKLDLLSRHLAEAMFVEDTDLSALLKGCVNLCGGPELSVADYAHIEDLDVLRIYLRRVVQSRGSSVNILLHGVPGTGKTQLARVLAADLEVDLFEIASEDSDGDPVGGVKRLQSFRAAQHFFVKRDALLLFDEVEDVFAGGALERGTAQNHKAWMNRALEANAIPTLWLSNDIGCMDPAFIRRFDLVVELPIPPKTQRAKIAAKICGDLVVEEVITRLADVESLAPAVVARAGHVVRSVRNAIDRDKTGETLLRIVDNTLKAQGHESMQCSPTLKLPELYDPQFISADSDLQRIAEAINLSRNARLCLFGPPGTGKSAYGRWLADQLEIPLHTKRGSDLMSPFVGETERNIASAFRQAQRDGALLLIDEVDSFLRSRDEGAARWEQGMVNEMLAQMEVFEGVLIASTNLMDNLDAAALRRFDLKVRFDYLDPAKAGELLRRHCEKLGVLCPETFDVSCLRHLTPGDFAVVNRQQRFKSASSFHEFLVALQAEVAMKAVSKAVIGFVH